MSGAPAVQRSISSPLNLNETVNRLKNATGVMQLPDRYKWDTSCRDGTIGGYPADDTLRPSVTLPVIDLNDRGSNDTTIRATVAREIGKAAEEWGFFQVRNHGVPKRVIHNMLSHGRNFFALPVEVKERGVFNEREKNKNSYYQGYGGRFPHLNTRVPWIEHFGESEHPSSGVEDLARKVWPDGNPSFCLSVHEYNDALKKLGTDILELLADYIGLPPDYFSKHFKEDKAYQINWRYNYYPSCPEPDMAMGLGPHTDPNTLTILSQDRPGGFQLRKNDFWFDVDPVADALLVNIGDTLQTWTNGRLPSVLHRVVVNQESERLSLIYFMSPQEGTKIDIIPESSPNTGDNPRKCHDSATWSHLFRSAKLAEYVEHT